MIWVVVAVLTLVRGGGGGVRLAVRCGPGLTTSPLIGQPAPDLTLPRLDGEGEVDLSSFDGDILVVDFFASWCLECIDEHSALVETATVYQDRGVRFAGVAFQDRPEAANAFLDDLGRSEITEYLDDPGPGRRSLSACSVSPKRSSSTRRGSSWPKWSVPATACCWHRRSMGYSPATSRASRWWATPRAVPAAETISPVGDGHPRVESEWQFQPVGPHQVCVCEDIGCRPVGDDPAIVDHQAARAQLEGIWQVVRDHEHGDVEAGEDRSELAPACRVEV